LHGFFWLHSRRPPSPTWTTLCPASRAALSRIDLQYQDGEGLVTANTGECVLMSLCNQPALMEIPQRRCDADVADSSTWAFASGRGSMAPSCGGSKARERCGTWSLLKLQKCRPHGQQHGVATRRAAALLAAASVGSTLTARCGDARASPPWPRPKPLAAGPLSILNTLLEPPIDFAYPVRVNAR
jgi:hypothetical protein